jgi:hypothetical protein
MKLALIVAARQLANLLTPRSGANLLHLFKMLGDFSI